MQCSYKISHHTSNSSLLCRVLCKIVVFKNRNDPQLCEEKCYAGLSHSKHLLKNIYTVMLASFLFTDEIIFFCGRIEKPTE